MFLKRLGTKLIFWQSNGSLVLYSFYIEKENKQTKTKQKNNQTNKQTKQTNKPKNL